jgi:hypothetical protein
MEAKPAKNKPLMNGVRLVFRRLRFHALWARFAGPPVERIFVSFVIFVVAFGKCFWTSDVMRIIEDRHSEAQTLE